MKSTYLLVFALISCGHHSSKEHGEDVIDLQSKFDRVYAEVDAALDPKTKWPSLDDCDGTLWAGLSCSIGFDTDIKLAEYSPGEIHRRPYKACWTEQDGDVGSKTTVSRDMLKGYMACLWARQDYQGLARLAFYGERHNWIMGKPDWFLSRVAMGTNLQGILGRALFKLSGEDDDRSYRVLPEVHAPVSADYERHIQTQTILLSHAVDDARTVDINQTALEALKRNAKADPNDPLFAAALGLFTGDQSRTMELLLGEAYCPPYARGTHADTYCKLVWLQAAKILL